MTVRETVNATKQKFGQTDLEDLFAGASRVLVAKGKKVVTFDMKKTKPGEPEFAAAVLGPTGNLRAPAIRTGKTWLIGFSEDAYGEQFG